MDDIEGPIETTGLKVTLGGIRSIESNSEWERATADYFAEIYNDSSNIDGAKVTLVITDIVPGTTTSRRGLNSIMRSLQSDSSVEVTYNQIMSYRSSDSNDLTNDDIVKYPLSSNRFRERYVGKLKLLNGYKDLTDVSPISSPTSNGSKAGKGSKTKSGKGTNTKSGNLVPRVPRMDALLEVLIPSLKVEVKLCQCQLQAVPSIRPRPAGRGLESTHIRILNS